MNAKFYAFVSMSDCHVEPLEGCNTFEDAAEMVEKMESQGTYVPFIFSREGLNQFVESVKNLNERI